VNMGEMTLGEEKPFAILIENKGKGSLNIKNFTIGHKNNGTPLNQKAIQPGKKVRVALSYTARKKGIIKYSFTLTSNDPVSPLVRIPILGNVR